MEVRKKEMARIRMITRTIERNQYDCMVVKGNEVATHVVTIGNVDGLKDEKITKMIKEQCEKEGYLFVKVNDHQKKDVIMGMTEDEFIQHAKVIER